jgi:hypothetical protein
MKRIPTLCTVVFLVVTLAGSVGLQSSESDTSSDKLLIRKAVVELYIKGLQIRDFELIKDICTPDALLMSVGDEDKLQVTTLDTWSKRFDPGNPPFQTLDYSILRIDTAGTAAQVKILFILNGARRVTDFLHLLKIEGRWRVVNIIDF